MLDVTGAETVVEGNLCEPQVRSSETAQYLGLDGFQASRCKTATRRADEPSWSTIGLNV